ncbi:Stk1 family PASTA domain-containing Ser/Thr kinase [Actinomadura sp. HBU206391]|uniref:Stk1 family PASTA domain-containing Ser/Thr kinase n=1 Tax=Actinomadura sp. HBU206391 TaxID=2731692 RepID=UPI00164F791B|nr:Stk1 family PASTA domain-containing Ser/Thr kinase [Actinomadura sp. HBU206391]MBC6461270.1 Stk1 family PASTA domain-containing Ser/Thr kinase [Actinomadura sp. HBU206391]
MDTTVADPLVGQVLDGRYRIESRIARGGMATVYLSKDLKLDRIIALKVMHAGLAQDDDFVRRFIGEAKSSAALSHPNVVAVFDQGTDKQHVFLAMEYVPGRTLRDLLTERGRLGPRQALEIMQPVLAALGAAHRAGLVHRDVKPENVLLTGDGLVKVADFGLARAESASKQTKTGMIIGTVGYLAPEQVLSGHADVRSDVYAAGVMLFELITGRQPHQGETPLAVAYKHVNEVVPLPSSVAPGIPPQLDALVAMATSHDPARRPQDAGRFLAAVADTHRNLPPNIDQVSANATSVLQSGPPVPTHPRVGAGAHTSVIPMGAVAQEPQPRAPFLDRLIDFVTGRFVLIALGVIAVVVIGWAVWYQAAGQYAHVPRNIVGMSAEEARARLTEDGIRFKAGRPAYSDKVKKNHVVSVDPAPGERVKQDQVVTFVLSRGRQPIPVPDVTGKSLDEAKKALENNGFTAGDVTRAPSQTVPKDAVLRTDPKAGDKQSPDEPVGIVLSNGVQLPNLAGQPSDPAANQLRSMGLNVKVEEQQDPSKPPGTVLSQNPPPGTAVSHGDEVTLYVNKKEDCFLPQFNPRCQNGGNGQEMLPVPSTVGRNVDEAKGILEGAGFKVDVKDVPGRQPGGQVLLQTPANGNAPRDSVVTIWR